MPLELEYIGQTSVPVEVPELLPERLRGMTVDQIRRLELFHGKCREPVGEFFRLGGSADDLVLRFHGDLSGVHWIGHRMSTGRIEIHGPAGRHVGSEMTGGEIHVFGSTGGWVGAEMHGGLIHVRGSSGHLAGAAYRGSVRGMTGGTLLIEGTAGNEVGLSMRRGLILVGGGVGDAAGVNMIAGNIFVLGPCGIRPGAGMRRGTIALLGPEQPRLLPTFVAGRVFRPVFWRVMLLSWCRLGFPFPEELFDVPLRIYHGDFVGEGRGEILLPERG